MTTGWRFWLVRPGQDLLLSPYDHGPAWPTAEMTAKCSTNPAHRPPAADCECGVYAERDVQSAHERVRRHQRAVERNLAWLAQRGIRRPALPGYVVGAVELTAAVSFVPRAGMLRIGADELRAASARIVNLYVQPGSSDPHVGERLADRYRVPVTADEPVCAGPSGGGDQI